MPGILDITLIFLGLAAGIASFLNGGDSLHKLFLGLIIGFMMYLIVSYQLEITNYLSPAVWNGYQRFLANNTTGVLSAILLSIPVLGLFFMLNNKFQIHTSYKSISHILLGILLPVFLIGILANLAEASFLTDSAFWRKIFDFFEQSMLYRVFEKLPWVIFLLLGFLIFYKSLFLLLVAFFEWIWKVLIPQFYRGWNESRKHPKDDTIEEFRAGGNEYED
ncbi:hypothetical protein GW846_02760 [Candidatus Gracilibacteria bacterium]|nr:hypothetical protein [Candidatus Gracilibacteria bacterium]